MIEINAKITFDSYEFRRVKPMGSNCVLYTKQNLIGKEVCIIPVDMHTTDRYIESCKDENGQYHLQMQIKEVIYKKVTEGGNTGRIYMNSKYLGVDCIIVEAPNLNYFD